MRKGLKLENTIDTFMDKNYVTVEQEKRLKKLFTVIMILVISIGFLVLLDIMLVTKMNVGPFLAVRTKVYESGSKEYYGLFYKVIKYREEEGRCDTVLGGWGLKYNSKPVVMTLEDLSLMLRNDYKTNYKKLYQSYVKLTGKIYKIDSEKKIVTLRYEDQNGTYYTMDAVCSLVDKRVNINKLEEGDTISIFGSIYDYTPRNNNTPQQIELKNCYL